MKTHGDMRDHDPEFALYIEDRERDRIEGDGSIDESFKERIDLRLEVQDLRRRCLELRGLLEGSLNLVPRVSSDDPMAPALAEWCGKVREKLK